MTAQTSNDFSINSLSPFGKDVYSKMAKDVIPEGVKVYNLIKFNESQLLGNEYVQPVTLTLEHGFTYAGNGGTIAKLNPGVANVNQSAKIKGYTLILRSLIGVDAIRATSNDKNSFLRVTDFKFKNMLKSFVRRLEVQLMYGQVGLGIVDSVAGSVVTIKTGEWAPGIWAGCENMSVDIYNGSTFRETVELSAVSILDRTITVNGSTAAVANDTLYYHGSFGKEFAGLHKIITNTGELFGINAANFSLWKGNIVDVGTSSVFAKLTFDKVQEGVAQAQGKGLVEQKVSLIVNPYSWKNLMTELSALRRLDSSYSDAEAKQGMQVIRFYSQAGEIEIISSIYCKESYAYMIAPESFSRIGNCDIVFGLDANEAEMSGMTKYVKLVEDYDAFEMRARTNQALYCDAPGIQTLFRYIKSL